jgi:hypothetical protein
MGLNKKVNAGGVFLRVLDGSIIRKSEKGGAGLELYKTKNPQTDEPVEYYIERFSSIDGKLVKFDRVEKEEHKIYGWNLHLLDDVEMILSLKDNSPVTNRVLKMLENVDLDKRLTIEVWKDADGKQVIQFKQPDEDGNLQNIKQAYFRNKDGEGNLPEPKKIAGKWNYSAQDEALYEAAMAYLKTINESGADALAEYRDNVANQVEAGTYTHHETENPQSEVKVTTEDLKANSAGAGAGSGAGDPNDDDIPF